MTPSSAPRFLLPDRSCCSCIARLLLDLITAAVATLLATPGALPGSTGPASTGCVREAPGRNLLGSPGTPRAKVSRGATAARRGPEQPHRRVRVTAELLYACPTPPQWPSASRRADNGGPGVDGGVRQCRRLAGQCTIRDPGGPSYRTRRVARSRGRGVRTPSDAAFAGKDPVPAPQSPV